MEAQSSLNIKGPKGNKVLNSVDLNSSLDTFLGLLSSELGLTKEAIIIKKGFPPKQIAINSSTLPTSLSSSGIRNKDTLIVEEDPLLASSKKVEPSSISHQESQAKVQKNEKSQDQKALVDQYMIETSDGMFMHRRIINADGSCLFNSVGLAMKDSLKVSNELRKVIADIVLKDKNNFDEAILGKAPSVYASWIKEDSSWGGGIELMILADYFKCEIAAVDIVNLRYDIFGQGNNYTQRIYLIYSGIHYDLCVKNYQKNGDVETEVRVFSPDDSSTLEDALNLARLLKSKKEFTDVSSFTLQCGICFEGLKGQKEALEHANKTGHMNFSQINQ